MNDQDQYEFIENILGDKEEREISDSDSENENEKINFN